MFSFMKKDKDKTEKKEKKDKKDPKKGVKESSSGGKLTTDELLRLDEVRRSLKIRTRRKEKEKLPSGITADYSANFNLGINSTVPEEETSENLNSSSPLSGSNSETSLNSLSRDGSTFPTSPTQGPPLPPARGILKAKSLFSHEGAAAASVEEQYDESKLVENTLKNELIIYEKPPSVLTPVKKGPPTLPKRFSATNGNQQAVVEDYNVYSIPRSVNPLGASAAASIAAAAGLVKQESPSSEATESIAFSPVHCSPGEDYGADFVVSKIVGNLSLPPLLTASLPVPRELTITRQASGDFGFSLRRAVVVERDGGSYSSAGIRRTVIFAEPANGAMAIESGLLPGDRLLEVNGQNVENHSRDDIIDIIRSSGDTVTLKVQPVAELVELSRRWGLDGRVVDVNSVVARAGTLRRTGSLRHRGGTKAKSEDDLQREKAWLESGRLWIHHPHGFSAARKAEDRPGHAEGKLAVKLESNGEILYVDEDEIDKANPPQFDLAEDVANLRYLNESSVLHTLRQRYAASLPHTNAGHSLVVVNPVTPLAIYSERIIQLFKGCKAEDMPPHIYASAQSAYRAMLASRCDQSLVFLGRSGSGKTLNFRNALHYLCVAAGCPSKTITVEKLNSIFLLLEAFGNCRTALNTNATRFTNIFSLDFDQSGQLASGSIQVLMPERVRVTKRPEGEPTFHVFYELVAGAGGDLRKHLHLDNISPSEPCAFMTPLQKPEDRQKASVNWARLNGALESLGVSEDEGRVLWSILAAIYHLGVAGGVRGPGNKAVFARPASAQKAANLLGFSLEELAQFTFNASPAGLTSGRASFRSPSPVSGDKGTLEKQLEPMEALEGFAQGLYVETLNALVALINRSISSTAHTISSIILVDTPGFQNPATVGRKTGANFQDFCHNYTQERLQLLFHDTQFTAQMNRYAQEHIEVHGESDNEEVPSPAPLVDFLDKSPQGAVIRASLTNIKDAERRGLLWVLDEEALLPVPSEDEVLSKLKAMYGDRDAEQLFTTAQKHQLTVRHMQGTNCVTYNMSGWLKSARENPVSRNAAVVLSESQKEEIATLFRSCRGPLPTTVTGSIAGIEGSQSLRRASSIRRTFTSGTAGIKRKSLALQLKFQLDGLIETLRRTRPRFVHCFLPHHKAGLNELASDSSSSNNEPVNVPLLRSQLRGSELLPAIRLYRQGYPDHIPFGEFVRRFALLAPADARPSFAIKALTSTAEDRQAAETLLLHIDLERTSYRVGLSQIFFRAGVFTQLEDQRDEKISGQMIRFQAYCRGYLARKRLSKLRLQDVAIRCIQRNVRKYIAIKSWPWWRLMLRLSPLLNVHRTEEVLKAQTEELENLRSRVAALEKERADLKYTNDRLETKVSELTADLAEEHSTATLATERLEAETVQRLKLEKEVVDLQKKVESLTSDHEKLEMEVLLTRSIDFNGDGQSEDSDDQSGDNSVYKQKYERAARELEFMKQRLQQQHEDDLEQMVAIKKQLEKKLADAYEEVEEQRQVVAQWKRKSQRLGAELNDTRLLLEEQSNRNAVLEKKQRKFDSDLQQLQDEIRQEKLMKERVMRERDAAFSDKLVAEQTLQSVQLELEMRGERLAALTSEMEEMTADGKTDADVAALRRAKHDLETKLKDQEEELDDLAGQVQILESARLRLEMAMEQLRKEMKREIAQRDEEMEDVRCSAQKKVKALEAQLENEHEERTQLLRTRHELERQLVAATEQAARAVDEDLIQKLKRDLKRTKALLKDAQSQLERARSDTPSKVLLRQLRNQLEDSEFARTAAIKGRQHAEQELADLQQQLEDALKSKGELEEKYVSTNRERSSLQAQLDDSEAEMGEMMRKYKAAVAQLSINQITLQEQATQLAILESERANLKEQVAELSARLENVEVDAQAAHAQKRMELKMKEMESKFDLEQTSKTRLEAQVNRLKEALEKSQQESDSLRNKEQLTQESIRRLQRQLRDLREELGSAGQRDADTSQQLRELQQRIELLESENATLVKDLSLAVRRIEDLQAAMQGEMDSDSDEEARSSDSDSDDSDSSLGTFLSQRNQPSLLSSPGRRSEAASSGSLSPSASHIDLGYSPRSNPLDDSSA